MRPFLFLLLALTASACDSDSVLGAGEAFTFRTDGTDVATAIVQADDGTLVVVGSVEGVPRPADGTLAFPAVLRFGLDGELLSSEVFRDIGYGDVTNVAALRGGLVLAVTSGYDDPGGHVLRLLRADPRGRRGDALLEIPYGYAGPGAVVSFQDGSVVAAVSARGGPGEEVHRLLPAGGLAWSVQVAGVSGMAPAPDGGVYVQEVSAEGIELVRRRPSDGAEVWRVAMDPAWTSHRIAALPDGVAQLERRDSFEEGSVVRLVRYGADGSLRSTQVVAQAPGAAPGEEFAQRSVGPVALAGLPDGRAAVGWVETNASGGVDPVDVFVTLVGESVGPARRFGREGYVASLAALTPLADGRLAAAGAIGPRRVSGYGGDDLDVLVSLYDTD